LIPFKITMMKRYTFIYTLLLFIIPTLLNAQSIYVAKKQMDKYNYAAAIDILKEAVRNDKTSSKAIPMLAECYRLQHDIPNAKATYEKAVTLPDAKAESYYYYAQALQSTGDYSKAREMFQKYSQMDPADAKGKLFAIHCDSVLGPWNGFKPKYEAKLVNSINTDQSDFGPAFYNGDLVFASDFIRNSATAAKYGWTGRGFLNIMSAHPDKPGEHWDNFAKPSDFATGLNTEFHDGPASFSSDGKTMYFTRSFYGKAKREGIFKTNMLKIYSASKTNNSWGEAKPFFLNSTEYSVGHPTLSSDSQTLYFASDMPGGKGGTDLWMCKWKGDSWGPATNLGSVINTAENEMFPTMREDGVLFFASDGHPGYGALDIFKAKMVNENWSTPINLKNPINSSYDDFAIAFAPGDKNGYFSSNRPGGVGSDDIYAFRIPEVPVLPTFLSGVVKDKTSFLPLAGSTVFVLNKVTGKVKILKTDAEGMFKTLLEAPGDYTVKAMLPNYIADCTPFPIMALKPGETITAPRDLLLDKLVINKTFRVDNIYYDFDKYNIREDAKPELDKLVQIMKENQINVELGSHTDCRGSFEYNDKLSQNRAESAVNYIISTGIDKNRITAKGYGERQLTNKCSDGIECTPEEHQANRRTEFKVTSLIITDVKSDQFDYSKYREGDVSEINTLPSGFFNQCK